MAGAIASRGNAQKEFEELMRIMVGLRCEVTRRNDGKLYSDVTSELDQIRAEIQAAGRGKGDPWKTVQDAKRRVGDIQKDVIRKDASHHKSSFHGDEAGTVKDGKIGVGGSPLRL